MRKEKRKNIMEKKKKYTKGKKEDEGHRKIEHQKQYEKYIFEKE